MNKLKESILIVFFLIVLTSLNSVLSCQYTDIETYYEESEYFYYDLRVIGENLNLDELIKVEINGFTINATNRLNVPITLEIEYVRNAPWFGVINDVKAIKVNIEPNDFEIIEDSFATTFLCSSKCSISLRKYKMVEPNIVTSEVKSLPKTRIVCKQCVGKDCLDDNSPCSTDNQCGSSICNIAGYCGYQKIVECPNGLLNCNDQACLKPSLKKVGEAYKCSFECISDRFENGICLKSTSQIQQEEDKRRTGLITFGVIALIVLSAGIWYFAFHKRKKESKKTEETKKERERLSNEILEFKKEKKHLEKKIGDFNDSINKGKKSIKKLKKKIKNSRGIVKEKFEKGLKAEEKKQKKRFESLKRKEKSLSKKENKINWLEDHLDGRKKEYEKESHKTYIKKGLDKYKKRYPNIEFDPTSGYLRFSNSGEYLHRFIYRRKFDLKPGELIHHIDADKLNNEIWNLSALQSGLHTHFNHTKVIFQNWESGIKELKEQLNMDFSDFPEHIQKEIKKRKIK